MLWVGMDCRRDEGVLAEMGQLGKGLRKWRSESVGEKQS